MVEKEAYLSVLSRYIHLNPVRIKAMSKARIKEKVGILQEYPWSSLHGYLRTELTGGIELKDKIVGQSIIGRDEFIGWVKERYIDKEKREEVPAVKEIQRYGSQESILKTIKEETGKSVEELKIEKGKYRQVAMDILYRLGGMKGEEIGRIFGVGYTCVSQERRRLYERMQKDGNLRVLISKIETIFE